MKKNIFKLFSFFLIFNLLSATQVFAQRLSVTEDWDDDYETGESFEYGDYDAWDFSNYTEEDLQALLNVIDAYDENGNINSDILEILEEAGYAVDVSDYDNSSTNYTTYSHSVEGNEFVLDWYGLLTQEQSDALESKIQELADRYGIGIYLVTIDDYEKYASDVERAAEKIFDQYGFGLGERRSMMQLLLSMNDRSYDVDCHGFGRDAFDGRKYDLIEAFKDNFRKNDWFGGLCDFVNGAEYILAQDAQQGINYQALYNERLAENNKKAWTVFVFVALIVALIFSSIRLSSEKKKMKNVAFATEAKSYISEQGVQMRTQNDVFKYQTSHTRTIETSKSSGGGGGGHSHSSGHF